MIKQLRKNSYSHNKEKQVGKGEKEPAVETRESLQKLARMLRKKLVQEDWHLCTKKLTSVEDYIIFDTELFLK